MNELDLFQGWRSASIDWVLANAKPRTDIADTLVLAAGAVPDAIHIVSHGLYGASADLGEGVGEVELTRMGAGAVFGEMAWLAGSKAASATVKAVETSECLVLPYKVLDAKIAEDPAFAAEFMGALARLLANRIRAKDAALALQLRAAQGLDKSNPLVAELAAALDEFKALAIRIDKDTRANAAAEAGFVDEMCRSLRRLVKSLQSAVRTIGAQNPAAADLLGEKAKTEFLPYMLATETLARFYNKPRGYAGDFLTIEHIYEHHQGGSTHIGRVLDEAAHTFETYEAVRNRRGLLKERIVAATNAAGGQARIMSLACGPARELFDAYAELPAARRPKATLLDIDAEALKLVGTRLQAEGLAAHATLLQANLIRLAMGKQQLEVEPQHLVYSIGLIDYFNDDFVVKLLHWIHARLAPGGSVILGNFHDANPIKAFMDYVLEWKLIHRSEADMQRLYAASPFDGCSEIVFEPAKVNLFAVGVKAAA